MTTTDINSGNKENDILLKVDNISAGYDASEVLKNISVNIRENKVVALLGRNGVGKTTLLRSIIGQVAIKSGSITFKSSEIHKMSADKRARMGIGYVPQGRDIFPGLTVWENLLVGMSISGKDGEKHLDLVYELFPVLKEMLKRKGGVLSGGQQQQLAIGRALLTNPKLLILDEPTEGIQPSIIDQIEDAVKKLKTMDMSIILVEQYLDFAKMASDFFYILDRGRIVEEGEISKLNEDLISKHLTV
jgi:urea transport system ATP-binding protein